MTVGNQKRAQGSQPIKSLVTMLLRGTFVDGSTGKLGIATSNILRLPYKILEQITLILGQDQNLGLFNHITKVADKLSTFRRELLRGVS